MVGVGVQVEVLGVLGEFESSEIVVEVWLGLKGIINIWILNLLLGRLWVAPG